MDFPQKKAEFLNAVAEAVVMEEIVAELVLNWDQAGIKLVPSSVWTIERQGEKRVEMVAVNNKRQITAVFCGTMLGEFLPVQLIYQGIIDCCHFPYPLIGTSRIHQIIGLMSAQGWTTYINHTIVSYIQKTREHIGEDTTKLETVLHQPANQTYTGICECQTHIISVCYIYLWGW